MIILDQQYVSRELRDYLNTGHVPVLRNAAAEDARQGEYQYVLVSADREHDYARFLSLLTALSMRTALA